MNDNDNRQPIAPQVDELMANRIAYEVLHSTADQEWPAGADFDRAERILDRAKGVALIEREQRLGRRA